MKRLFALLLTVVMILSVAALAGCGKQNTAETTVDGGDAASSAEATDGAAEEPVAALDAIELSSFTTAAGDYELTFEPIDLGFLKGAEGTHDFDGDYYDGKYYITDKAGKLVYVYAIDGTTATLENKFELEKSYEAVSVNNEGKVIISHGIFEADELNDDGTVTQLTYKHDVECSKTEDFAVTTWSSADPTVIRGGEESPWVFENINNNDTRVGNLTMVFDCAVSADHVLIGGNYTEDGEEHYRIGVYDYDGNELALTAAGDPTGYPALNETSNGIISANVSKVYLHDIDGNPLGSINDLKAEAGMDSSIVSTFWVKSISVADDAVYMLIYAKKTDDTCEALLYKVTGF